MVAGTAELISKIGSDIIECHSDGEQPSKVSTSKVPSNLECRLIDFILEIMCFLSCRGFRIRFLPLELSTVLFERKEGSTFLRYVGVQKEFR